MEIKFYLPFNNKLLNIIKIIEINYIIYCCLFGGVLIDFGIKLPIWTENNQFGAVFMNFCI